MRVFWLAAAALGTASTLAACGGSGTPSGGPVAVVAAGASLNPDGFAYPSPPGGYGLSARLGTTAGSIIQNFKFLGYPNGDSSQGLQPISLADYYDPCSKRYALLRLSAASVWCTYCQAETAAVVAEKATLASERVVVIQALGDGQTLGIGATQTDLDYWVKKESSNFTEMLDPGFANLGSFFLASEVPWNADIDPRTMEILQAATGFGGDLNADISLPLAQVKGSPAYPVTVTCN
jgi:hypothetical protein